jgi:hypothetical protein
MGCPLVGTTEPLTATSMTACETSSAGDTMRAGENLDTTDKFTWKIPMEIPMENPVKFR